MIHISKLSCLFLIFVSSAIAQEVSVFAVGNLNPTYSVHLNYFPNLQVIGGNRSSLGGGTESRWYFGQHNAVGILYTQSPSDEKLSVPSTRQTFISPMMNWNIAALAIQRLPLGRLIPFLSEGPGAVVTNGYSDSGWSADFALAIGVGSDYRLSRRTSVRFGVTFLDTRQGCYGDPTCRAGWGVVKDVRVGIVYRRLTARK